MRAATAVASVAALCATSLCAGVAAERLEAEGSSHITHISQLETLDRLDPALRNFLGSMWTELQEVKKGKHAAAAARSAVPSEIGAVDELRAALHQLSGRVEQCESETTPFVQDMERRRLQDEETLCRGTGLTAMFIVCCPSSPGNDMNGHRRGLQGAQGCDTFPSVCPSGCAQSFVSYFEACQGIIGELAPAEVQKFTLFYTDCIEVAQQNAAALGDARPAMIFHVVVLNSEAAQQAALFGDGSSSPAPPFAPVVLPPSPSAVDCSTAEISRQVDAITAECCDEPGEDCTGGHIHTCNPGCGALVMPLWTTCQAELGRDVTKTLRDAVGLCLPPAPPPPSGGLEIAQEFRRICTAANLTTCVPACNAVTYGYLLSIEIDGRGTVMTCNKQDRKYSWQGQASLGGYIGAVIAAFVSSVVSGAAGTYLVTLSEDADISTDLTIQPGQSVAVHGDRALPAPPGDRTTAAIFNSCLSLCVFNSLSVSNRPFSTAWGSGGFLIRDGGSVSLSYLELSGPSLSRVATLLPYRFQ